MKVSFLLFPGMTPSEEQKRAWQSGGVVPVAPFRAMTSYHFWIYQTWMLLNDHQIECSLIEELPQRGSTDCAGTEKQIVFVHGDWSALFCHQRKYLPPNIFIVHVVADGLPNPLAHFYLVQNRKHTHFLKNSFFVPHWPQPDLVPRSEERGDRFENIGFVGYLENLVPLLKSAEWSKRLKKELGLSFCVVSPDSWYDYRHLDAVIAIRDFSKKSYYYKPASKLYNAWLAGVPLIGGADSAFREDGIAGKNYLVATTEEELWEQLKALKEDIGLRHSLVKEGRKAVALFSREATLKYWSYLIQSGLARKAEEWFAASPLKKKYWVVRNQWDCCRDKLVRYPFDWWKHSPFYQKYTISLNDIPNNDFLKKEIAKIQGYLKQLESENERLYVKKLLLAWNALLSLLKELLSYREYRFICGDSKRFASITEETMGFFEKIKEGEKEDSFLQELKNIQAAYCYWKKRKRVYIKNFYQINTKSLEAEQALYEDSILPFLKKGEESIEKFSQEVISYAKKTLFLEKKLSKESHKEGLEELLIKAAYWGSRAVFFAASLVDALRKEALWEIHVHRHSLCWAKRTMEGYEKAVKALSEGKREVAYWCQQSAYWSSGVAARSAMFYKLYPKYSLSYLWKVAQRWSWVGWLRASFLAKAFSLLGDFGPSRWLIQEIVRITQPVDTAAQNSIDEFIDYFMVNPERIEFLFNKEGSC